MNNEETVTFPLTKEESLGCANLALAQAWLCNFDELRHTNYFKFSLKQKMKAAADELEKETIKWNDMLFQNAEEDYNKVVESIEYLTHLMAKRNPEELAVAVHFLKDYFKSKENESK